MEVREISKMKNSQSREVGSSIFYSGGQLTRFSYKPKPSDVNILPFCDEDAEVNENNGKLQIILFYNKIKRNSFDQMYFSMSYIRKTNIWQMAGF